MVGDCGVTKHSGRSAAGAASGLRPFGAEPQDASLAEPLVPNAWAERASNGVVELIREIGIYRLGGNDGCPCTSFEVLNVHVAVSCHKSEQCVRVYTHHADYTDENYRTDTSILEPIAREVLRQVDGYYNAGGEYAEGFTVRYRAWEDDNPYRVAASEAGDAQ
jgi:hypothetical protein